MKETRNYYTPNYADHTRFGGRIYESDYESDYETDYRGKDNVHGSEIAKRIASDMKFDEECRKNLTNRLRNSYSNYSQIEKEK